MLKYQGTYRVHYETDKKGHPQEFTFIPCGIKRGSSICRHSYNLLSVYIPSSKVINRLLLEYPEVFTANQTGDTEGTLLFSETMISKTAVILKARTKGKNLNPRPRHITVSDNQKQILSDRMKLINIQSNLWRKTQEIDTKTDLKQKVI